MSAWTRWFCRNHWRVCEAAKSCTKLSEHLSGLVNPCNRSQSHLDNSEVSLLLNMCVMVSGMTFHERADQRSNQPNTRSTSHALSTTLMSGRSLRMSQFQTKRLSTSNHPLRKVEASATLQIEWHFLSNNYPQFS